MPRKLLSLVGRLKPWKPTRSLPSYSEPTPETSRKLTREEEAEIALKNTVFSPGVPGALLVFFLLTMLSVPLVQSLTEWRGADGRLRSLELLNIAPEWSKILGVRGFRDAWNLLPHAEELKSVEEALERDSVVAGWLLPQVQAVLTGAVGAGNEQVYPGRDGWLFYRADVDHVTGAPFLSPERLRVRSRLPGVQPDPVAAIVQFRDQLAARGIDLIVLPVPVKPTVDGEMLSAAVNPGRALNNPSYSSFLDRLRAAHVRVFDATTLLMEHKRASAMEPLYLQTDTHWRPETMEFVARKLADEIDPGAQGRSAGATTTRELSITAAGDIATMLKLPEASPIHPPESVKVRQVVSGDELWRPTPEAEILLLGDSFSNIFSFHAMGWGESAGLAEHLSHALGTPIDTILRNSGAGSATREILRQELARGRDRLAGKKLVVWEFAARELSSGDWKLMDLQLGTPQPTHFLSLERGKQVLAEATVVAVSAAPRPGTVPYKDHIVTVHLRDLSIDGAPAAPGTEALSYLWSMKDNEWTPAARLRPGDRVRITLQPWPDVAPQLEKINRRDIDDPALQLEEPLWGELQQEQAPATVR